MTRKETTNTFIELINEGKQIVKQLHDANPHREKDAFKYVLRDKLKKVDLEDGTTFCKRKFLRSLRKAVKLTGAKLIRNNHKVRVVIEG